MWPYGSSVGSVGRAVNTGKSVIYHKIPNIVNTNNVRSHKYCFALCKNSKKKGLLGGRTK